MFARRTKWSLTENRFGQSLRSARASGAKLIDLTVSNPTHCNFNFDSHAILSALSHAESLNYDPDPQGLPSARKAIAEYYNGLTLRNSAGGVSSQQIFLTSSTSEAYSYLFRLLCDPGDEVLVPRPSYPLFDFLAEIQDVQLRRYELFYDHGWHLDLGGLQAAITQRTRAILIVNPNNPTGSFVRRSEMDQLVVFCRDRNLALISDEVFLDYEIEGASETSAAFSDQCLSFALSGLSKISCLPQMKLAWIVANGPAELRQEAHARLEVIADTYLSVNAPIQHALPYFLDQRTNIQPQLLQRVRRNLARLDKELESARVIQRLLVEGGWYVVLRLPMRSDEELAIDMIKRLRIIVHPGHFYDFQQEGFVVLSLITPEDEFHEGVQGISEFVQKLL